MASISSDEAAQRLLAAVADRIIPADDWPGATAAGAVTYLQRHRDHVDPDLWNDSLLPGLAALDAASRQRRGQGFAELDTEAADRLLADVEAGRLPEWPHLRAPFVETMVRLVAEGYYADPGNGGNRDAASWHMIGFDAHPLPLEGIQLGEVDLATRRLDELADVYDAIVVGAGAGGGMAAGMLAEAGLRVLVVERERWLRTDEVGRDHLRNHRLSLYGHNTGPALDGYPRSFLHPDGREQVVLPHEGGYQNNAMTVGGGTRVYGAQAWRFHPDDFRMATRYGVPEDSALRDWPFGYEELEAYYERVEWEMGVCGDGTAHAGAGGRQRGYPMPAFPLSEEGRRLRRAGEQLGWEVGPVPLLINTTARDGRPACQRCGQCVGFACPVNAKNGTHNTVLVRALASGRCDLATGALVERIETGPNGRVTGVRVADETGARRLVRAGHVVVACGAIESARLLLNSASDREPTGLGNATDQVGRHLQGHVYTGAFGLFDEPIQDGLGPGPCIATRSFAHGNPGVIGGGMLANEFVKMPIAHWRQALPPDAPRWGLEGKELMRDGYRRTAQIMGPVEEIPVADARVRVSPTVRDRHGLPVAMLSGSVHPETIRTAEMLRSHAVTWLAEAGARRVWSRPAGAGLSGGQHQAGTLRMGVDPAVSVTDPTGRVHGHDNLWVADGSLHVTNGGVNPVLTILALACRTATMLAQA